MKLITIRSQILRVLDAWTRQYPPDKHQGTEKERIRIELGRIDLSVASPKVIEAIIGNPSWACQQRCRECGEYNDTVLEIGEKQDYESATTFICERCAVAAAAAFRPIVRDHRADAQGESK
jgi:hypothetical protein